MLRDALIARITEHAREVVDLAQQMILDDLDEVVPVDSGALRDSRSIRESDGPTTAGMEVTYDAEYAAATDTGSVAHEIPGPLSFFWKEAGMQVIVPGGGTKNGNTFVNKDGTLVIGKGHVNHPGTAGTRWWSNIMNDEWWSLTLRLAADRVG